MKTSDDMPPSTIERALRKDRSALEELLLLRYDWLRDVASLAVPTMFRDRISVDELVQDIFVRVLRGFNDFTPHNGEPSLFFWLKTIAQNTAKDAVRKQVRSREAVLIDHTATGKSDSMSQLISSLAVATDPRASVVACGQEMTQAFHVALANLDPKYQQVLELLYFDQLTVAQTAQRMQTTPAAVRGLRQRAREKIREAMVRLSHYV